jgi:hypothetical protein
MSESSNSTATRQFLGTKVTALVARSGRLSQLTPSRVGLRPQDKPYAPTGAHFRAANHRLRKIRAAIDRRRGLMEQSWRGARPQHALVYMAMLEREVDRARRTFGLFFEIFSQRGSDFAPALAAHDVIAADCYTAIREADPFVLDRPLLKPVCYMEHGASPSTNRRGVQLNRLLGESNPFPVIRIPWDRDNPWQAVFLHEVAHNLQADLGIWNENRDAVAKRLAGMSNPLATTVYRRWHKEIFADLAALLLGGTAAAWGMLEFLAHPDSRALTYRPGGAHPTGYFRGLLLAEMLRRMGFATEGARVRKVWTGLYNPARGHRLPGHLLNTAGTIIPAVVDEIAYQPRRNLGQRALADILPFTRDQEAAIRRGGMLLARGRTPQLAPRHMVSASRFALQMGGDPQRVSDLVIHHLAGLAAAQRAQPLIGSRRAAA